MSSFYLGFPAEVRKKITSHSVEELRAMNDVFDVEKLKRLIAMNPSSLDLRYTGRPMAIRLDPPTATEPYGAFVMTLKPGINVRIAIKKRHVEAALGHENIHGLEILQALERLRRYSVWAIHVVSAQFVNSRHGVSIRLDADRAIPLLRTVAPRGSEERNEAMELIAMIDSGDFLKAMSMLLGVPASKSLGRVFLPRLLTLRTTSRTYGHELRNTACPSLMQVHPPGTGKTYRMTRMRTMIPSSVGLVGHVSRTALIYDGQLKAEGPALVYEHLVRDEFGIAKMDAKSASAIEGTLKSGMSTGRRVRSGQGSQARPVDKEHINYRRFMANPVLDARRRKFVPEHEHLVVTDQVQYIMSLLGFRQASARTRRFTRLDIVRHGYSLDGVTDGEYAMWTPTGQVVHPRVAWTMTVYLRQHPEILAKRGLLVKKGHVRMPRLYDNMTSSMTLKRLDERRHEIINHLEKAPRGATTIEVPTVEPRLDHAMPKELLIGHDESHDEEPGEDGEDHDKLEEDMEGEEEGDVMALDETATTVMSKLRDMDIDYAYRHDGDNHVRLIKAVPPRRVWCVDDLCFGHVGSLTDMPDEYKAKILDVIRRHASVSEEEDEGDEGEAHDDGSA